MFASETMFPGAFRAYSADLTHLRRHLREVPIEQGEMLEEPGHPVEAVYFPQTGMISLIVQMPEDSSVEVGTVGSQGAVGMAVGLGSRVPFICALVQVSGTALCIPASAFRAAAGQSGRIRDLIVKYSEQLFLADSIHTTTQAPVRPTVGQIKGGSELLPWGRQSRRRALRIRMVSCDMFYAEVRGGKENRSPDVAQVILTIEGSRPNLPIGLSVTVQFGPCPSKS
jgi:hypothetical protein